MRPGRNGCIASPAKGRGRLVAMLMAIALAIGTCGQILPVVARATSRPPAQRSSQAAADRALSEAEAAFQEGRLDEALSKCRQAIDQGPPSAHAYYLLGGIQAERGAQQEAKTALLQSLKLDPSRLATRVFLARLYLQSKEFGAAVEQFQAALKLGDNSGVARYGLALAFLAQSRYADALPHLEAAVQADPKNPEKRLTLLLAELQLKQTDKARRDVAQTGKLFPHDPWLAYRMGKLLLENKMPGEAEAEFEHAAASLATAPGAAPPDINQADFFLQIAQVRFKHHDYAAALQALERAQAGNLTPSLQAAALYVRGASLLALGNAPDARPLLQEAARGDSSQAEYVARSIWADLLAGDLPAAIAKADAARQQWPNDAIVQHLLAVVERERNPARAHVAFSQPWRLKGEGLVCCPCKVPCPCRSNAPPTYNHCENVGVFHIRQGYYGKVPLDGFVFALASATMGQEDVPATLYVDRSSTDDQIIALERLSQSFNPLRPSLLLDVRRVPISFTNSADPTYEVKIPAVLLIKIRRQLDSRGQPLLSTAALDFFSNQIEYARNQTYKLWDESGALRFDYSGRQANFRTIDLDSSAYLNQSMLIQFADFSGFFNARQLELIKNLKLPTLRSYPKAGDQAPTQPGR